MKFILIFLSFLYVFSFSPKLITIDLRLNNNKTYIIKNKDDDSTFSFIKNLNINILPEKILFLIKRIFINNNIMHTCQSTKYQEYETFYCMKNKENSNLFNIKMNFNFDDYTLTIPFTELFSKKLKFYFFNFYTKPEITSIILSAKEKYKINGQLRILNSVNETEEKNSTDIINKTEQKNEKTEPQNSGIGWLGISLIVLLSLIVIYVTYVGFRYYKRKKYQNPSFYYKITEEMFDDITPIE